MRDLSRLNKYRVPHPIFGLERDNKNGCFILRGPCGMGLMVIASSDANWDHVSVSLKNRTPNWKEMSFIKDQFFESDEVVMQLHVADQDHINVHPNCLHLWRPHEETIPLPPKEFV